MGEHFVNLPARFPLAKTFWGEYNADSYDTKGGVQMDLCDMAQVRALLSRHGFTFQKSLGQNFLTAAWVPERIAAESGADGTTGVLEIGPGVGCLTAALAKRAGRVVAVELDRRLLPVLSETLAGLPNVEVVQGDALKLDLSALVSERFSGLTPAVCANLPYNVAAPVLTRLLETAYFARVTVMVQREMALRIAASPGSKDYGAFSVLCRFYSEPKLLFDVPPSCFEPRPKVTSAVVQLERRDAPPTDVDRTLFFRTVRAAFGERRKTLPNALAAGFPELAKAELTRAVEDCGLSPAVRGEALPLTEFAALAKRLEALL